NAAITDRHCVTIKGVTHCTWTETDSGSLEVRFEGTDGMAHVLHVYQLPSAVFDCNDQMVCNTFTEAGFIANRIVHAGGLAPLLSSITPTTTSLDVLASEGSQILAAEQKQNYQWDVSALTDPNIPDHATLLVDSENISGAFELLQLLAQTVAPVASLGNQALADILYGQDQLPTTLTGPNGPLAVFVALRDGTGTQTLTDYANVQQTRLAELETLINGNLGSDQQAAARSANAAHALRSSHRLVTDALPPPSDLATGEAPALTYSVLAQLATGALLDTDTVTVTSPGTLTSGKGTTVTRPLSATSTAGAKIT